MALAVRLLPQPCTPRSSSPFGSGRPKARAFSEKAAPRRPSQPFRSSRPPTASSDRVGGEVLQQPALADDLPLLLQHQLDVVGAELAVVGHRLGEGVLGLGERQPEGRGDELLGLLAGELHRRAAGLAEHRDDLPEERQQVVGGGERHVEDRDLLLQLRRDDQRGREEQHGGVGRLEGVGQVAQRPHHRRVGRGRGGSPSAPPARARPAAPPPGAPRPARVTPSGGGRVAGAAEPAEARVTVQPSRALPWRCGQVAEQRLEPLLLAGHQVDQRVAGPHQRVELLQEGGQGGGGGAGGGAASRGPGVAMGGPA